MGVGAEWGVAKTEAARMLYEEAELAVTLP